MAEVVDPLAGLRAERKRILILGEEYTVARMRRSRMQRLTAMQDSLQDMSDDDLDAQVDRLAEILAVSLEGETADLEERLRKAWLGEELGFEELAAIVKAATDIAGEQLGAGEA